MQIGFLAVFLAACASAPLPSPVPQALAVPEGNGLRYRALAKGVQSYTCQAKPGTPAQYEWVFTAPRAQLYDESGAEAGAHFAGPTWQLADGSRVVGVAKQKTPSPQGSIPWLLLEAKSSEGTGKLEGVKYIQRTDTTGGTAPSDPCDAGHAGEVRDQAYTATYLFYAP